MNLKDSMKSHLPMGFQSILNILIYQLKAQRSGFQLERRSRFAVKYWSLLQYELRKASFDEVVGQGLAFLRESHGGCNSPPDCCQEPPFESILACSPQELNRPGLDSYLSLFEVVGQNGLEPSTSRLSVVCSSQLSYWPISVHFFKRYILICTL